MRFSVVLMSAIMVQIIIPPLLPVHASQPKRAIHLPSLRGSSETVTREDTEGMPMDRDLKKKKKKKGKKDKKDHDDSDSDSNDNDDKDDKDDDDDDDENKNNGPVGRVGGVDSRASDSVGAGTGSKINCGQVRGEDLKDDCEKGNEKLQEGTAMRNAFDQYLVKCVKDLQQECDILRLEGRESMKCTEPFGPRCRERWVKNNDD